MRISDWSSDVCSSDLPVHREGAVVVRTGRRHAWRRRRMRHRRGLACRVGAAPPRIAGPDPVAVSAVCQAGDRLAQPGTTVDLAPGAAVLSLLQAIVRRGADAGPADGECTIVVDRKSVV